MQDTLLRNFVDSNDLHSEQTGAETFFHPNKPILFCLVAMQQSVPDSESAPNTVTKRYEALFGNIPLHCEALQSAL